MEPMYSSIFNLISYIRYALFKLELKFLRNFKPTTEYHIKKLCSDFNITQYSINPDGSIDINANTIIHINLENFPIKIKSVRGDFSYNTQVTSLKGCPERVEGKLICRFNKLTSFEGCPKFIGNGIFCEHNNISSFKGFPEVLNGVLSFMENPAVEILNLNANREFIDLLNEYDVIRGNRVVETRLRQALEDSGCRDIPEEFNFKHYELI